MKHRSRRMVGVVVLGVASACLFLLAGCGHSPTSYVPAGGEPRDPFGGKQLYGVAATSVDSSVVYSQGLVTVAKGGVINLGMPGKYHSLTVPPLAVLRDQTITVKTTTYNYPGGKVVTFDFGPNGLTFLLPAKLKVDASIFGPGKVTELRLYYYDPVGLAWLLQQVVPVQNSSVTFSIYHFSKYGIS